MGFDFWDVVLLVVLLGVSLEAWRLYLKHLREGGTPLFDKGGMLSGLGMGDDSTGGMDGADGSGSGSGSSRAAGMEQELAKLKERVQVLEAIVTDSGSDLSRRIDSL